MSSVMDTTPKYLKPYLFHGLGLLGLEWGEGDKEAHCDCPWCGRQSKFSINVLNGRWRCFTCAEGTEKGGGNIHTFLRKLYEASNLRTRNHDYEDLAAHRRLLYMDTIVHWGLVKSMLTEEWLVPGYNAEGKLCQLYKYTHCEGRLALLPTPTLGHQLHHSEDSYRADKPLVYVCEGPWDGMALWEVLGNAKQTDSGFAATASREHNLLSGASVIAVPGCTVFMEAWLPLLLDHGVRLMYDNDHPRYNAHTERQTAPAGTAGMLRVTRMLLGAGHSPDNVEYLQWGTDGYDPTLPSGYDVRDCLCGPAPTAAAAAVAVAGNGSAKAGEPRPLAARIGALVGLLGKLARPKAQAPAKGNGTASTKAAANSPSGGQLECLPCGSYKLLVNAWKRALKWTDGLDHALAVMLASITSTKSIGDQLWIKVIGPAACGKSTLCEAVTVCRKYVTAKSTIRGFHSGYRGEGSGGEDVSLISQLSGKTLVTKDGDTLLQSPNLSQILAEARDLYDSTSRTHYRNATSRDYEGVRMTWLLCGTSSLRAIDSSELGERFLDCVIMEGINEDQEDEILWRVANKADRVLGLEADGSEQYEPELANAMQLTGGYVEYLRENALEVLGGIGNPEWAKRSCTKLAKFVAYMRARPSTRQEETAERELASRLVSQLTRLSKCLAMVLNRDEVDSSVMSRVKRVAMDTARGQTLSIASYLYDSDGGLEPRSLAMFMSRPEEKVKVMLRFLRQISVVDVYTPKSAKGVTGRPKWQLTPRMRKLYGDVKALGAELE